MKLISLVISFYVCTSPALALYSWKPEVSSLLNGYSISLLDPPTTQHSSTTVDPIFGFILILCLYLLQTHFGISSFSHPDNALEVCGLLTPLHIVPEWYFLCQYAMLKAVPNKNAGFIILLTSIFTFFLLGEIRNLTTLSLLPLVNNCFSLSSFFQSLLSFLWIGAQFPQVKFLSYGRILTLHYYFLLMCILFSLKA